MVISVWPAPRNVSPLIRLGRWSALLAGVVYGHYRFGYLLKQESEIQQREDKIKEKLWDKLTAERAAAQKEEMNYLAKEAGVTPKGLE